MSLGRTVQGGHIELDMRVLGRALGRMLLVVAPFVLVAALCGQLVVGFTTPRATAEARLLIHRRAAMPTAMLEGAGGRASIGASDLANAIQIIRSRDLAESVIAELDLAAMPEFHSAPVSDGFRSLLATLDLARAESSAKGDERVLRRFQSRLDAHPIADTPIIGITFSSDNPRIAALVANKVADTYMALQAGVADQSGVEPDPVDVQLVSAALPPQSSPARNSLLITLVFNAALLMIAGVFALLRELLSGRALKSVTGPEIVPPSMNVTRGIAPAVRWSEGGDVRRMMPATPSFARPDVLPGEVQDSLRLVAERIAVQAARRVVVAMGETSSEARPLAAVALARQLSRRGSRVLLVDLNGDGADGDAMASGSAPLSGFADLFADEASFAQAIFRDRSSRAHIIPGGSKPLPAGLAVDPELGGRLEALLAALDATYDHIILDADWRLALALAPRAAAVVLVAESPENDLRRHAAREALAAVTKAEVAVLTVAPIAGSRPWTRTGGEVA